MVSRNRRVVVSLIEEDNEAWQAGDKLKSKERDMKRNKGK
jgi:hypothetical protein